MQETIRFVFDDRIVEVGFSKSSPYTPTTTVLEYLRSLPTHKGVKEGCAEGDCGACTVVVAEAGDHGKLVYKAFDSCLVFLPMIHGKQLITVENLAYYKEKKRMLHPVQKMMVEMNGAQCGYCTPGVVMSLFSLYKSHLNPSRKTIETALTGNLCRCTGYQSILEAAEKACSGYGKDHFSQYEAVVSGMLKEIAANAETLEFRRGKQHYLKPFSLDEALSLRKKYPHATVINGSTDVSLLQTKKREIISLIIDLSGVESLAYCREEPDMHVIGSGLPLEKLRLFSEGRLPAFYNMLSVFGSLQIRNMATLGGNIGSASPIGDTLPLLIAFKAKVRVASATSERLIEIEKFIVGYHKTALRDDELIKEVIIPKTGPGTVVSSYKVSKRKDMDISTVSAAFRLHLNGGVVGETIIAFGGMAAVPVRATATEKFLGGKPWSRNTVEDAMAILKEEFHPISDARAEAEFRKVAAKNLLLKFYNETK